MTAFETRLYVGVLLSLSLSTLGCGDDRAPTPDGSVGDTGALSDVRLPDGASSVDGSPDAAMATDAGGGDVSAGSQTGRLTAFVASGVTYETATQSGVTDSDGTFTYLPGESVRFLIANVLLGEATGAAELTLFDLAGTTPIVRGIEVRIALWTNPAFERLVTLAVLLATLDANGDPRDGVEILPEVAEIFRGSELEPDEGALIDGGATSLQRAPQPGDLNRTVLEAQDMFEVAHPVVTPDRAMAALYEQMGVEAESYRRTRSVYEREGASRRIQSWVLNADGSVSSLNVDVGDGGDDVITSYTYDDFGYLIREENSLITNVITRDVAGNVIRYVAGSWSSVLTRNERGAVVREERNLDGGPAFVRTSEYDANHDLLRLTTQDNRHEYTRDEQGRPLTIRTEQLSSGTVNVITFTFDDEGHVLTKERSSSAEGLLERWTFTYEAGLLRTGVKESFGPEGLRAVSRDEFDDHGLASVRRTTTTRDGEVSSVTTNVVNADGIVLRSETDNGNDGSVDSARTTEVNAEGYSVRRETYDGSVDGMATTLLMDEYTRTGWHLLVPTPCTPTSSFLVGVAPNCPL